MIAAKRVVTLSLAALAAIALSLTLAHAQEPSYSPDGAWFAMGNVGGRAVPFMDIYTSGPTTNGREGTVLCTLSAPPQDTPLGKVNTTTTGHGNWIRVEKNRFAFTVWRILVLAESPMAGAPIGAVKFWGSIRITGPDAFVGTMNAQYYVYGPDGQLAPFGPPIGGVTTAGTRIAVQVE